MGGVLGTGLLALMLAFVALAIVGVYLLAAQYHRFGQLRWRRTAVVAAMVTYLFGVAAFTLVPIPASKAASCARGFGGLDLDPMNLVRDLRTSLAPGLGAALHDPVFTQVALNVLLFIPFGFLAVKGLGLRWWQATGLALVGSLVIETTQYTGIYGLFCRYRVADVGDLITNTTGGLLGALIAITPLFGWIPTPAQLDAAETRRPVTRARRLWGMVFDLAFIQGALVLGEAVTAVSLAVLGRPALAGWRQNLLSMVLVATLVVVPVLGSRRASLGLRCVWIDVRSPDGSPAGLPRAALRTLIGTGGYALVVVINQATGVDLSWLEGLWCLVAAIALLTDRQGRGLSFRVSRLSPIPRDPVDAQVTRPGRD